MYEYEYDDYDDNDAYCDYAGHEWADAGGGLLMCLICEAEKWNDAYNLTEHLNKRYIDWGGSMSGWSDYDYE